MTANSSVVVNVALALGASFLPAMLGRDYRICCIPDYYCGSRRVYSTVAGLVAGLVFELAFRGRE